MYLATYALDVTLLLFLMWFIYSSATVYIYRKTPFLIGIFLTLMVILAYAGRIMAGPEYWHLRPLHIWLNILGYSVTPLIPVAMALIFDRTLLRNHQFLLLPSLVNIAATLLSPRYGYIFRVDAGNHFSRGDYFFIFVAAYLFNFLLLVISNLEICKRHHYPIVKDLVALSLFTVAGTSIQLFYPQTHVAWHCVVLALLLYYLLISEFDSSFDPLTGLYNRAAFEKAAKHIAESEAFSVIVLDINDFKKVNDTYGHDGGDAVMKAVAATIRKSFNHNFTCYRLGGDEFFILGRETDRAKIEEHLRTMTANLATVRAGGIPLPTVSYGYSIFQAGKEMDFHKTLKEADRQMYHHKKIHKAGSGAGAATPPEKPAPQEPLL